MRALVLFLIGLACVAVLILFQDSLGVFKLVLAACIVLCYFFSFKCLYDRMTAATGSKRQGVLVKLLVYIVVALTLISVACQFLIKVKWKP